MAPASDAHLLNDSQRRHLGVTLSQMQRLLDEVVALLNTPSRPDGLVTDADDIPPGFAPAAVTAIARLDAEITSLAARFDLPRRESSRFRWVRAVLGRLIDDLEDTRARSMRGYGEVHPRLAAALDPALRGMQEQLRGLLATLEWGARS